MKNQALFKDSICIYLGKIDDIDRTFLNGNILGENGKVVAANSGFIWDPMYGPKAPNVVRNYTLSANDPRLKWDRENVLAVRVVDVGGEGGMLSADLNVSMKGLANYLIIDKGTDEPQSLPGGLLSHTIVLKNQSPLAEISGILQINVENSDTKQGTRQYNHSPVCEYLSWLVSFFLLLFIVRSTLDKFSKHVRIKASATYLSSPTPPRAAELRLQTSRRKPPNPSAATGRGLSVFLLM